MTDHRRRIADHVGDHPGTHFNGLVRALDLAPGQVQYHVRRLLDRDALEREQLYGRTHYYPPGYDAWERATLALFRRETARDVLATLLAGGPQAPATVAEEVGIARSTLEYHLDHLTECDVVRKERDERGRVTLVLARPKETARLLGAVTPSLPERLVDRFTRLVDDALEPAGDGR